MSIAAWVTKRFPGSREITSDAELKEILFSILVEFDSFCRKHSIPYYLASGTCLGAVRHGGFIPWDDDIDVRIPRPHYERFIALASGLLANRYKVLAMETGPNHIYPFAKLVDTHTICIEKRIRKNAEDGIWVDVFPVDGCADPESIEFKKNQKKIKRLRGLLALSSTAAFISDSWIKTLPRLVCVGICKILGPRFFLSRIVSLAKKYDYDASEYVTLAVWGYGSRECTPKSVVDELIEKQFEGHSFYIPKNYDAYLTRMYGDYMTPPSKEKQIYRHNLVAFWK